MKDAAADTGVLRKHLAAGMMPVANVEFVADPPGKHGGPADAGGKAPASTGVRSVLEGARHEILVQTPYLVLTHEAQRLFSCDARDCGSSNEWANGVFNVRELYGPDRNQVYRAYVIEQAEHWSYIALYLIERGNQRSYVHIDHLRVQGVGAGSYLSLLEINQYLGVKRDELKQPQSLAQKLDAVAQS